ncbi:MAG TPA: TolC family outer membrane protein [Steroidobacteraceae bacterium]|nr:TolC family outer membrane protein [Steroidobacteraceae bacterium]
MRGRIRLALSLSALLACASSAQADDLIQVYQRALQNDPLVREAEANRLAAMEAKPRALSGLLPAFDANGSMGKRESDGSRTIAQVNPLNGEVRNVAALTESEDDFMQYQLQLVQPVFRWDRWMTLKQASSQVAQAEADYQAAQLDLMLRVSQRYFDVLAARDTLQSEETARDAIARQLEQAEKRFEVGLIAITDVQEARAAHDNGSAAVILAKRNLATAIELLRELTGETVDVFAAPTDTMPLMIPAPANEQQWVDTAMEQNLALISSRLAAEIARDTISIRRGGHLPSIDIVATRGNTDSEGTDINTVPDPQSGLPVVSSSPSDSDITQDQVALQVFFPIYSGGAVRSSVREAVYLHRAARERLERTTRETERQTRDAYLGVLAEVSRVQALKQARESSRTALQATEAGYEVGTRTAVDVLVARRTLAQAETNYARSRYDYLVNIVRLKQAAGILGVKDIEEINGWLKVPTAVPRPGQLEGQPPGATPEQPPRTTQTTPTTQAGS